MTQGTACITLERPWLELTLGAPMQVLSWSVNRPGYANATRILWREVRDADLTPDLDVPLWLERELSAHGAGDAVALLTSRDVSTYSTARAVVEGAEALAVATVGLSNAEAVGRRLTPPALAGHGTINIALRITPGQGRGLTEGALAEALSIAVQARSATVLAAGIRLSDGALASGTGTDCVAVAACPGDIAYAGLHTALGEAVGRAVTEAMTEGLARWLANEGHRLPAGSERMGDATS